MADGTLKVGTITTSSGSGSITIPSGVTLSGGGLANTPAFFVYSNGLNTISPSSATKATFNTEFFDSDSVYDTSTNKFTVPSGGAGKYVVTAQAEGQSIAGTSNMNNFETYIYKNGSKIVEGSHSHQNNNGYRIRNTVVSILDLAVADYIEIYVYGETASGNIYVVGTVDAKTNFSAYKLIGA
jgi:hypothetical protein